MLDSIPSDRRIILLMCSSLLVASCRNGLFEENSPAAFSNTLSFGSTGETSRDGRTVIFTDDTFAVRSDQAADLSTLHRKPYEASGLYYVSYDDPGAAIGYGRFADQVLYQDSKRMVMRIDNAADVDGASSFAHSSSNGKCGGLQQIDRYPAIPPAAYLTALDQSSLQLAEFSKDPRTEELINLVDTGRIFTTINHLVSYGTRHHSTETGQRAAQWMADTGLGKFKELRSDVTIERYRHRSTPQTSTIARITGRTNPNDIVIIGSHIDSTANENPQIAPGADDNASGSATLIEAFKLIVESGITFDNTIEFHSYAAEEVGLIGSAEIAANYKAQGKNVLAMMQIDMNGYNAGESGKMWFVSNNTSAELNTYLEQLVQSYIGVPTGRKILTAGSSDHASWHRLGFPVAFPTENPDSHNPHIHTIADTPEKLDMTYSKQFAQLAIAFAFHKAEAIKSGSESLTLQKSDDLFLALSSGSAQQFESSISASELVGGIALCRGSFISCQTNPQAHITYEASKRQGGRQFFRSLKNLAIEARQPWTILGYDLQDNLRWGREIIFERR